MGGQACVFYGAAEFSRDVDLLVLADSSNLDSLQAAVLDLKAEPIAVPSLRREFLLAGHAVHFRCRRADVAGMRLDVMSSLREVASFDELWERRTTIEVEGQSLDILGLADLVAAKKTQRDKDWPMIRRLVEQDYFRRPEKPSMQSIEFWLRELRSPELLVAAAARWPEVASRLAPNRPLIKKATAGSVEDVGQALESEEQAIRRQDREYWRPLKLELEQFRRQSRPTPLS